MISAGDILSKRHVTYDHPPSRSSFDGSGSSDVSLFLNKLKPEVALPFTRFPLTVIIFVNDGDNYGPDCN